MPSAYPPPCATQDINHKCVKSNVPCAVLCEQNRLWNVIRNRTECSPIFKNTPRSSYTPLSFHSFVGCTLHTKSIEIYQKIMENLFENHEKSWFWRSWGLQGGSWGGSWGHLGSNSRKSDQKRRKSDLVDPPLGDPFEGQNGKKK